MLSPGAASKVQGPEIRGVSPPGPQGISNDSGNSACGRKGTRLGVRDLGPAPFSLLLPCGHRQVTPGFLSNKWDEGHCCVTSVCIVREVAPLNRDLQSTVAVLVTTAYCSGHRSSSVIREKRRRDTAHHVLTVTPRSAQPRRAPRRHSPPFHRCAGRPSRCLTCSRRNGSVCWDNTGKKLPEIRV